MKKRCNKIGMMALILFAVQGVYAIQWVQDVPSGAKWSTAGNWSTAVPTTNDSAVFITSQANTYDVDVDTAAYTRLQQVQNHNYTFNGAGSLNVSINPTSNYQNCFITTGGTATYNVGVNVAVRSSSISAQINTGSGAATVFNNSFALTEGTLNLTGAVTFNGDLNLSGRLRIGDGSSVVIGGSGTTTISSDYISTSGTGSLYLNRTGAYTLSNPAGHLRADKSKVYFGAANAVADGTDVKLYQLDANAALISNGDYDQNFGVLYLFGTSGLDAQIDMNNSDCIWTFEDSTGTWTHNLNIANVDTNNTVIRFSIDAGTGLSETQIGQITLNGEALTAADTTVKGGYLYITPATTIPEPATVSLLGISALGILFYRRHMLKK